MPFVQHAATLAAQDAIAINRRLVELTGGAVERVTQAGRLATWMCDMLVEAPMREVLIVGTSDDDDDAELELSLTRDRVERVLAMLDAKRANGGPSPSEVKAHEAATLRV